MALCVYLAGCTPSLPASSEEIMVVNSKTLIEPPSNDIMIATPTDFVKGSPTQEIKTLKPSMVTERKECKEPLSDYDQLTINGYIINKRTYEMLAYAQMLYGGQINITNDAITQGSYTNAIEESFNSHAGGGVVDLSVMAPGTYEILYQDLDLLIQALRLAGFAAWFRDFDVLYDGSPPHIHAIAIGDRTLSLAAREQLAGPFGYFWGYNGIKTEDNIPIRDPHDGPILCNWMIELGYPNKTATPSPE